jgi:hypothetical protein
VDVLNARMVFILKTNHALNVKVDANLVKLSGTALLVTRDMKWPVEFAVRIHVAPAHLLLATHAKITTFLAVGIALIVL